MLRGHIVAMGGGGFSMEADNPLLDDFALALTGKDRPRVCFLPTASGDSRDYIDRFYAAFGEDRCQPTHLSLFRRCDDARDIREVVAEQDVLYVGGGNVANLLALWHIHGLDSLVRRAWERGAVLCGVSAGMICWFEQALTDSFGAELAPLDALGFLPGSAAPHYDGEPRRRPRFHELVGSGELSDGLAADDGAALHFAGTRLVQVVSSRPTAAAYRVERRGAEVVETRLEARFLG
jgi:dipeptidase E